MNFIARLFKKAQSTKGVAKTPVAEHQAMPQTDPRNPGAPGMPGANPGREDPGQAQAGAQGEPTPRSDSANQAPDSAGR